MIEKRKKHVNLDCVLVQRPSSVQCSQTITAQFRYMNAVCGHWIWLAAYFRMSKKFHLPSNTYQMLHVACFLVSCRHTHTHTSIHTRVCQRHTRTHTYRARTERMQHNMHTYTAYICMTDQKQHMTMGFGRVWQLEISYIHWDWRIYCTFIKSDDMSMSKKKNSHLKI